MSAAGIEQRVLDFVRHRWQTIALCAYILAIGWVGLLPLDFNGAIDQPLINATGFALPVPPANAPDIATNIALFIPFGLLLRNLLRKARWHPALAVIVTFICGAGISYGIERGQLYSPARVSSIHDWVYNGAGVLIGMILEGGLVLAGHAVFLAYRRIADRFDDTLVRRPSAAAAWGVTILLMAGAWVPLDLTFSPNLVYNSVVETNLVPFARVSQLSTSVWPADAAGAASPSPRGLNDRWQTANDHLAHLAAYALLAILLYRYLTAHCRIRGMERTVWIVCCCLLVAGFSSMGQFFVISRVADVTELLVAVTGAVGGLLLAERIIAMWTAARSRARPPIQPLRHQLLTVALIACTAYLAARQLAPMDLHASADSVARQLGRIEWTPATSLFKAKLPVAVDDILRKLARYGLLAALIAWRQRSASAGSARHAIVPIAVSTTLAIAVTEVAQLLLPPRTPSVTDVGLALVGSAMGVMAFRVAAAYIDTLHRIEALRASPPVYNVEFDPATQGPAEIVPQRRPAPADPAPADPPPAETGDR